MLFFGFRYPLLELFVIADVVILIIMIIAEYETHPIIGEEIFRTPFTRFNEQSLRRTIKEEGFLFLSIIYVHGETAVYGNDKLAQFLVSVSTTRASFWNIECPEDTFYLEWYALHLLRYCEIATIVREVWKVYKMSFQGKEFLIR